jgi:hypothetical protein
MSILIGALMFVGVFLGAFTFCSFLIGSPGNGAGMRRVGNSPDGSMNGKAQKLKLHIAALEKRKLDMEREIEEMRRTKTEEMETSIAAQKEAALADISAWTEREEERLLKRLNKQYDAEAEKIQD